MQVDARKKRTANRLVPTGGVPGCVDFASWLSDDLLLIIGWFHAKEDSPVEASLVLGTQSIPLEVRYTLYQRPDIPGANLRTGKILTARLDTPGQGLAALGSLVIRTDNTTVDLAPSEITDVMTDLQTFVERSIMPLDAEEQAGIMELL